MRFCVSYKVPNNKLNLIFVFAIFATNLKFEVKVLIQGKQSGVELLHGLDCLPDLARHDEPLDVLPVPHAGQLSADLGLLAHTPGETLRRAAVAVVDEVGEDRVVEHRLLVPLLPRPTELLNGRLSSSPQLSHLSLDIKFERFLSKVGVHDLIGRLQPDCRIEAGR